MTSLRYMSIICDSLILRLRPHLQIRDGGHESKMSKVKQEYTKPTETTPSSDHIYCTIHLLLLRFALLAQLSSESSELSLLNDDVERRAEGEADKIEEEYPELRIQVLLCDKHSERGCRPGNL
jgi:hypothetical protein